MLTKTKDWNKIATVVKNIADTENSYMVGAADEIPGARCYSENGLSQLGTKLNFPSRFVSELLDYDHEELANEIIQTKCDDYFGSKKKGTSLLFREFADPDGKSRVHGVLTDRYSIFDDKEVVDIMESSDYLMGAEEFWSDITPDQFHTRFVSKERLHIPNDPSDLSMCVFVDNSMVGKSMLKIRFGLYRWACTNGVISDFKEFNIVRERHIGADKDWTRIVAEAMIDVKCYEQMLLDRVNKMACEKSAIYDMSEEDAVRYIKDKLTTSTKKAKEIIECFNVVYGGFSKWDLCNAITDVAHNAENLDTRLLYESKAMKVA